MKLPGLTPLPPKAHAVLAMGLVLAVLSAFWMSFIQPALTWRVQHRERLRDLVQEAERLGPMAARRPALQQEIESLQAQTTTDPGYVQEEDEARAAAAIQAKVQAMVAKHGATLKSAQPTASRTDAPFKGVTVRLELQGTLLSLINFFIELSHTTPTMLVDNVQLRPQRPGAVRQGMPGGDLLEARFDITGYLRGADTL